MRASRALALACGLLFLWMTSVTPTATSSARSSANRKVDVITLRVLDVSPSTPLITTTDEPLVVTVSATNTTGEAIAGVVLSAGRGSPIQSQSALDSALARPDVTDQPVTGAAQRPVTLLPDVPATLTFRTTTSIVNHGLCLCAVAAIYPLVLRAQTSAGIPLGTATTFVPAFDAKPVAARVAWVWPLLDRPHRLSASTVFIDDGLASSVAVGGRLDRALQVLELLPHDQQLTLVLDPDLLDELEIMATGRYTVHAGKVTIPGTGAQAAAAWLVRLRAVLANHPGMQVTLTPFADPDIQTLTDRGLTWSTNLPAAVAARVSDALGGAPATGSVGWPATATIGSRTLSALVRQGVRGLVLPTSSVTPQDGAASGIPAGVVRLSSHRVRVGVALTSAAVERYANSAVTRKGAGAAALPALVSEVAVRVTRQSQVSHPLAITAPRYIDANPALAARAITDTTSTPFARSATLAQLTSAAELPKSSSRLRGSSTPALPPDQIAAIAEVAEDVPTVSSLLSGDRTTTADPTATRLVAALPIALQRLESAGWQLDGATGGGAARSLIATLTRLLSGVRIVRPSSGQYTLASSNSELPVTLENNLDYPVRVRLVVRADKDLPGLSTDDTATTIDAHSKKIAHVPTVFDRPGRIQIEARLLAPDHRPLGDPVALTVRNTALGAIGVIITIVAGAILALALIVRGGRQLLRRRAKNAAESARKRGRAATTPAKAAR